MRGHVISKVREASYFLKQMGTCSENPEEFRFNLSAFLTSSRSASQYVFEDAKKQCKQDWYDNYINNTHFMKCFRDKFPMSAQTPRTEPNLFIYINLG
jgi:hypothetical protein